MELKVKEVQLPEAITFNYEELKQGLTKKAGFYSNLVFTSEQLPEAKAERAKLNKLKKALNDERIRQEKEYMKPFLKFKSQINEIINIIDEPVKAIDSQISNFEEAQKADKLEKIKAFWESTEHPEWLQCNRIFDQRWLNATFSMKKVQEAITERLEQIKADLATLEALPEFSFEAVECYADTLDINRAIHEGQRLADIQKRKMEAEAEKAKKQEEAGTQTATVIATVETPDGKKIPMGAVDVEIPKKYWMKFEALLSVEDATALKQFFEDRSIEFNAI